VLDVPGFFSFAVGLVRPRIFVSREMVSALSVEQLDVVLAHEREHVRRRDALRSVCARAATFLLWPPHRRELLGALALSAEQACDEAAVDWCEDRWLVAATIVGVARHPSLAPRASGIRGFGGASIEARVRHLLDPPPAGRAPRLGRWLALAGVLAVASVHRLHHLAEHLVGALRLVS
jgi:beta-lactamase regulating signal transducer with metallopeptidase domain